MNLNATMPTVEVGHQSFVAASLILPRVTLPTMSVKSFGSIPSSVTYHRNLAHAMHGLDSVYIIDCSMVDNTEVASNLTKYGQVCKGHLDGATGSRKSGKLIGTRNPEGEGIIERYLSGSKRISHGSILFSECRQMFSIRNLSYVVQPDTESGLGDCHGYISESLATTLGVNGKVTQYRFGVTDRYVAKGVVAVYPDSYMPAGVDAVLPESSFKGRCPELYVVQNHDCFFGIMNIAKPLSMKSSHQIIQCFTSTAAQDHLLAIAEDTLSKLMELRQYPTEFAQFMLESMNPDDDPEFSSPVLEILAADKYAQLHRHPVVDATLIRLMRKKLVEISTGKFLSATGLMATPLDGLKPGVVLTRSLPTGSHVFWRYPVRHYGDIRLVKVVNPTDMSSRQLARYFNGGLSKLNKHDTHRALTLSDGAFAVNSDWFLEVGGDHDGDLACFLLAADHQPLVDEMSTWEPLPEIQKPAKVSINKSLEQIAQDSMANGVGSLACMMSACRYWGLRDEYAYLGLQIQLVVDAFKSDTPVDDDYIKQLGFKLKSLETNQPDNTPWYQQYKDQTLFASQRANIKDTKGDTISLLMRMVDAEWAQSNSPFQPRPPRHFAYLFSHVTVRQSTLIRAEQHLNQYSLESQAIREEADGNEKRLRNLFKPLTQKWIDWSNQLRATIPADQMLEVVAAFWQPPHTKDATWVPTIVFRMFAPEIIAQVESLRTIDGISFRLMSSTVASNITTDPRNCVVAHDLKEGGLYLWDNNSGDRLGKVITDGVSKKTFIPAEGHMFPARILPNVNAGGKVSYYQVEFVAA